MGTKSRTRTVFGMTRTSSCVMLLLFLGGAAIDAHTFDLRPALWGTSAGLFSSGASSQDSSAAADKDTDKDEGEGEDAPPTWYERLRFSGDFRSRYEGFYREESETRHRGRFRLRLRVDTDINEDIRFQLQVASGDPGTPVSTNQTFKGFFQPKPFNLDRAYIAYNPVAASAITLGLGKFGSPQLRTQMTFDNDLNYEGAWQRVDLGLGENATFHFGGLQTAVNELSRASDSSMFSAFGGVTFDMGPHSLEVTAANYGWRNVDQVAQAQAGGSLASILTNDVVRDDSGTVLGYASEFNVVDIIGEANIETSKKQYPLRFLVEFARNTRAANDRDSGFWVETEYGSPREAGTWGATYTHGWIQQDVTPSAFMFSDIPGTNTRLNMFEVSYVPKSGLSLDVTLHLTKRLFIPEDDPNHLLTRLHVAAVVRF